MTDPTPDPDPGHGPDDPDLDDPLTADDILARAAVPVDGRSGGDSQATRLVTLAQSRYRLVRGHDGRIYATSPAGPAVAYTLRGKDGLRTRLARDFFETYGQTASGTALADALCVLEGQAERAEPELVALRVASAADGRLVLDLGGHECRCVLIGPEGWEVAERSPVLFRRSALTAPLPEPIRGGTLDPLRRCSTSTSRGSGSWWAGSSPRWCPTSPIRSCPCAASRAPPRPPPPAWPCAWSTPRPCR